jgi:beta-glucosidase
MPVAWPSAQEPGYKNPKLPVAARVADLLARMTVEEKIAQVRSMHAGTPKLNDALFADPAKLDSLYKDGIGMLNPDFGPPMEETIAQRNKLQHYLRTQTRLGIPVIFLDEAHHGLMAPDADIFPHGIGFASSWNPALIEKAYAHIAGQARVRGTSMVLAPVVDVTRDPRWGRTGETFGEDPYLNGMIGSAVVRGFQGSRDGSIAPNHIAATLKHFTGHGQPEGGINQGPADHSLRMLREVHMEPFRLCIENANPAAIMASYAEIDGIPSHANRWLLTEVLRNEWKYKGVVVSDWFGIDQLWKKHMVEATEEAAALRAFNAGVTIDLPFGVNYRRLLQLVNDKKIGMEALDAQVVRILTLKFKLGLFEEPVIGLERAKASIGRPEGRAIALEAASQSMILLKNQGNLLPIRKDRYKKIAVIGPMAAVNHLGDYSGIPAKNVSLLEGVRNKVGSSAEVLHAPGVILAKNMDAVSFVNFQKIDTVQFPTPEENQKLIAEAVRVAGQAEFVVLVVGETELISREAWPPKHYGDANTLDLLSDQEALVKAVVATGKPVLVYLVHGRPLSIHWIADNVPAIIDGWFMGQEAGNAFADILFGETNPSGKLTISVPRTVGQIPIFYNHKPSAQFFEYVTGKDVPLFPFGFGLSYTTFEYSAPRLSSATMPKNGSVTVEVDVTNTGRMAGDEIVQLYIRQKVSSATRPVKELKDFSRFRLNPGEKKTVQFTINASKLAYWTAGMKYEVEACHFDIMVGRSSVDVKAVDLTVN